MKEILKGCHGRSHLNCLTENMTYSYNIYIMIGQCVSSVHHNRGFGRQNNTLTNYYKDDVMVMTRALEPL